MATDMYAQGFGQFLKEPLPDLTVKSNPPQWRAGYQAAKKAYTAKSKVALKVEKVERVDYSNFTINWSVIQLVTKMPRFHQVNRDENLFPMMCMIRSTLWDKRDSIKSFTQLVSESEKCFDIILQWGYNEGVLTDADCLLHNYVVQVK